MEDLRGASPNPLHKRGLRKSSALPDFRMITNEKLIQNHAFLSLPLWGRFGGGSKYRSNEKHYPNNTDPIPGPFPNKSGYCTG
jgi:hypothetical protein